MRCEFRLRQTKTDSAAFTNIFAPVNKSSLREGVIRLMQDELARQTNAAAMARDEAISEESRAENKWDTHSQEAAYLAEGQAKLAGEIKASIELYRTLPLPDFSSEDVIALGAVVEIEASGGTSAWYFLGPRGGGLELNSEGRNVLVLTPHSPLGRQLLGKRVGDRVVTGNRGGSQGQRILSLR